ncbi:FmdE family protein [Sulfoacidibacillus thermotolerans]|uniref:Formylmethanofuran dehydrogenase n=1 Tax=Sulfoacidibacillus thermotolerans TaxID=1765684 RepID=A0A2U3CU01_SULT2|nr:FmdE family protein [Sulfoacidibacillus thermotolerans]PWI52498.1 formylmethanofuran dehydrogenase [Sulfoacidibacillus thermotolerans]
MELEQLTKITDEELKGAQYFHGHKCPAMPQGLRAGHLAMDLLGVERARGGGELRAIVEIGDHHFSGCFADGVQYATGCTFGKGNITKNPLGKFAVTLIDTKTGRAVRVTAKYERMKQCLDMPFFEQRKQGIPPFKLDPEVVEPLIEDVIRRDWKEMFDVTTFEQYPIEKQGESFNAVQCSECKEMVVTEYARELDGKLYCQTCFGAHVNRRG